MNNKEFLEKSQRQQSLVANIEEILKCHFQNAGIRVKILIQNNKKLSQENIKLRLRLYYLKFRQYLREL